MQSEPPAQQTFATENGLGPVLHDVDDYLGRPDNHSLLSTSTSRAPKPKTQSPAQHPATAPSKAKPTATIVPVQVGAPKSSASVSRLNTICQQKGLLLDWDIKEAASSPPGFTGTLTIGAETLVLEVAQPSKKDAKQILAEKGVDVAERMEARVRGGSEGAEAGSGANENWIGKLQGMFLVVCYGSSIVHPLHLYFSLRSKPLTIVFPPPSFLPHFPPALPPCPHFHPSHHPSEFYANATSPADSPSFTEYTDNMTNFAYELNIPHHGTPFGGRNTLFKTKKLAKNHAAKEAVQFLIQEGHVDPDGSVKKKKKAKLGLGVTAAGKEKDEMEEGAKTWGMKVNGTSFPFLAA